MSTKIDNLEARCNRCGWLGHTNQLKPIYLPDPTDPTEALPTPGCPACLSDHWLEYKEDTA